MIRIRNAEPGDMPGILSVHRAAFPAEDEAKLVTRLVEQGDVEGSLVALAPPPGLAPPEGASDAGRVVGHILFSRAEVVDEYGRSSPVLALAPMAVLPSWQDKGVGRCLIEAGLRQMTEAGWGLVVVIGDPSYYGQFGFVPAQERGVRPPFAVPRDSFMLRELKPRALRRIKGTMRYAEAFDELSMQAGRES